MDQNENKEISLSTNELTKLFEQMELRNLRYEFLEKIALLIIAALGLITALAWEEALKITFQELFSTLSPTGQRFLYPILITLASVFLSILISRLFLKKTRKNKK
jgi:hypothetical protein